MNKKFIFGGIIVTIFLTLMIYLFTKTNIQYESNIKKVIEKGRTVKVTASWVKEKNYQINKENKTVTFFIKDEFGNEMKVLFNGTLPNNFEIATSIVVTGQYKNGLFHAKDILTKCPSKYQDERKTKSASM